MQTPPTVSRVVVVDDDLMVRTAVANYLSLAPDLQLVASLESGEAALEYLARNEADLMLLDIRMGGVDGVAVSRLIRERHPDVKIVILTSFAEQDLVAEAMRAGVAGYVLKSARASQIITALRSARQGMQVVSPGTISTLMDRQQTGPGVNLDALTRREVEVLDLLCRGRSNAQIARDLALAESSVKMHVHAIMEKLGTRSRLETVVLVHQGELPA